MLRIRILDLPTDVQTALRDKSLEAAQLVNLNAFDQAVDGFILPADDRAFSDDLSSALPD